MQISGWFVWKSESWKSPGSCQPPLQFCSICIKLRRQKRLNRVFDWKHDMVTKSKHLKGRLVSCVFLVGNRVCLTMLFWSCVCWRHFLFRKVISMQCQCQCAKTQILSAGLGVYIGIGLWPIICYILCSCISQRIRKGHNKAERWWVCKYASGKVKKWLLDICIYVYIQIYLILKMWP